MSFPVTAADYRALARRRLPRFLFDYIDGGAGEERTLAANVDDFAGVRIRQRVLVDTSRVDTGALLLGESCALPLALAPVGLAGMMARRGEARAARVAEEAGVPFTLSTVGVCPLKEVAAARGAPFWFQLYMLRDRGAVEAILDAAWAAGCRTLVFTVDLPLPGPRHRDARNGLGTPGLRASLLRASQVLSRPRWIWDVALRGRPLRFGCLETQLPGARGLDEFRAWIDTQFDPGVTWRDIDWLRARWRGKLLLKGLLDVEDACASADAGVEAIVVSNHGGRQLDSVASGIRALPKIAAAVGDRCEILVDGGVRSGTDLFKALALGARGALVGRPWIWALAGAGETGLRDWLDTLQRELRLTMTLAGVTRTAEINLSHLEPD